MTSHSPIRRLALLVLLALPGCLGELGPGLADSGLTIATPADGAHVDSRSVRVRGTSGTETVSVNGVEVDVVGGSWGTTVEASGEGPLTIVVEALNETHRRDVVVDSIPPVLVLEEPQEPALITGDTLRLRGQILDDDEEVSLSADGEPVPLGPGGRFELTRTVAPGAHRVRLQVRDRAGHVRYRPVAAIVGDLAPYEALVEDAAALTLGADAFVELNVGLEDILNSDGFRQQLRALLIGDYGDVSIRGVEFTSAEIDIAPNMGGLSAQARIHGVHVRARACFDAVIDDICKSADLRVQTLEVGADVGVWAEEGRLRTATRSASVAAHGFSYDVSGVPGFIEDLFRGEIRSEIERQGRDGVAGVLEDELPAMLEDASLGAGVELLGTAVALEGTFREVSLDPAGLHVRLDLDTWAEAPLEDRMAAGYLRQPHGGLTRTDTTSVSAQISLDAINAATFALWSGFAPYDAGVLPGLRGDLTVEELALATQSQRVLGELAPPEAQVAGTLDLGLPPIVTLDELDGAIRITAADARVRLAARVSDGMAEADVPLVTLSLFLSAPIRVSTDPSGTLVAEVGEVTLTADAIEAPAGFLGGEDLDALLRELSPLLTSALLDVGGLRLPSLAGFELRDPSVLASDSRLRFDATLTYAGGGAIGL